MSIRARDVHKAIGGQSILEAIDLDARDGRVTGLLGPNGAGKTTLLRVLTGTVRPDRGMVEIDGTTIDVAGDRGAAARARVASLPDALGLYERLTAREHLRYFGRLQGLRGQALEAKISVLLERLGAADLADRRTQGFSQGERMKVALARALIADPPNVILDEPTNGLDVLTTRSVRALVRALRDEGRCVLFSSHVMQELAAVCDEIVVLVRGRVRARGTVDELRALTGSDALEDAFVHLVEEAERAHASARGGTIRA